MHDVCGIVRVGANPSKGPGQCCLRRYALAQVKRLVTVVSRFHMLVYLKSFTRVPLPFLVFIGYQPYSDL